MSPELFERLKITLLEELSKRDVRVPSSWNTAKIYDALVDAGFAEPIINVPSLMNGYTITATGREHLKTSPVKTILSSRANL